MDTTLELQKSCRYRRVKDSDVVKRSFGGIFVRVEDVGAFLGPFAPVLDKGLCKGTPAPVHSRMAGSSRMSCKGSRVIATTVWASCCSTSDETPQFSLGFEFGRLAAAICKPYSSRPARIGSMLSSARRSSTMPIPT